MAEEAVGFDKVSPIQAAIMVAPHLERRRRGIGRKRCRLSCNRQRPTTQALGAWSPATEAWRLNLGVCKQSGVGRHACTQANVVVEVVVVEIVLVEVVVVLLLLLLCKQIGVGRHACTLQCIEACLHRGK